MADTINGSKVKGAEIFIGEQNSKPRDGTGKRSPTRKIPWLKSLSTDEKTKGETVLVNIRDVSDVPYLPVPTLCPHGLRVRL